MALSYFGRLQHGLPEAIAPEGDSQGYNEEPSVELRMAGWLMVDMTTHISQWKYV